MKLVSLLRSIFMAALISSSLAVSALAQNAALTDEADPIQVEVSFGAYVLNISQVSLQDGRLDVDMWVWFRWKDADIRPDLMFEVTNGTISSRSESEVYDDGEFKLSSVRMQARIFHQFDVSRFPLDDHVIEVRFEDSSANSTELIFVADEGSALDPSVQVAGWTVGLKKIEIAPYTYKTNYGYSGAPAAEYSRVHMLISLDRNSYGALFKRYWISGLAVGLALISLMLKATETSARFGIGLGSIFAASANAITISSELPPTTAITLAEQVNLIAVAVIFACVFVSVFSFRLCDRGRMAGSARLDRIAVLVLGLIYIALNVAVMKFDING